MLSDKVLNSARQQAPGLVRQLIWGGGGGGHRLLLRLLPELILGTHIVEAQGQLLEVVL